MDQTFPSVEMQAEALIKVTCGISTNFKYPNVGLLDLIPCEKRLDEYPITYRSLR